MGEIAARAFAPATVANVGCGFDVLGFAVERLGDTVEARRSREPGVRISGVSGDRGALPRDPERNTAGVAAARVLAALDGEGAGVDLELVKGMPLASGLGSSAASAVAAAVAVNALFGGPLSKEELLACAVEGERVACGAAHADNVAPSLYGGFVLIRGGAPARVDRLPVPEELVCALVHPHLAISTRDARSVLPPSIPLSVAVEQWGNLAGLVAGLFRADYEMIGGAMRDLVAEPVRSGAVPGFERAREAALAAGALGFGLSGSGPTVCALCRGREKAEAVEHAVAEAFERDAHLRTDSLVSVVGAAGARLCDS